MFKNFFVRSYMGGKGKDSKDSRDSKDSKVA